MVIKTNTPATTGLRNGTIVNKDIAKNLEKLSSGLRINRASDDAAGLAVSEKMRKMIRETMMCQNNVQQGIDAANTADGALSEISDMMVRARELCVQASNGTYGEDDQHKLENEIRQLFEEVDRLTEYTHYNNTKLLRWDDWQGPPLVGRNVTGEVIPAGSIEWGALGIPGLPSQFDYTSRAKPATVTMPLDSSIDFSNWESLEGKTVTIPIGTGTSSVTVTFSQYSGAAFTERYPQGGTQIAINSASSVKDLLEGLAAQSAIIADVKVDTNARNITFTSIKTTGTETLNNMRTEGSPIPVNVSNTYSTGATYNNRSISSSGTYLKPLGGAYPRANYPFTYGADASLAVSLGAIVSDGQALTAAQVTDLTRNNPAASPSRHQLEINVLGTTKTITFSTGGTVGDVTGNATSQNIVIAAGMDGAALRTALTTAFANLGVTATWSGTSNPSLSLGVSGLSATQWGSISFREVTVPSTGSAGSTGGSWAEPAISVPSTSAATNRTALTINVGPGTPLPEAGQNLYVITVPTAAEIRAAVASSSGSKSAVSLGSLVFYNSTYDYSPKGVAWTAPTISPPQTATGGASSGTTDFAMADRTSGGTDIKDLTDEQLMNLVYGAVGASPAPDGQIYMVRATPPSYSNSSTVISFRKTITTGRTITDPGTTGDLVSGSSARITSTSYQYFTREAAVPRGPDVLQIPLTGGGDVDIAELAGSGFQMTIQTNPTASTTTVQRLFEFRTTGTTGTLDNATGSYIINISGCVTPDDVADRIEAAIKTATGATAGADVNVSAGVDGKISISSRYRASSTSFPGVYNDGHGASGLFGAGTVTGSLTGGTKDVPPGTTVDFSSINGTNAADLLGKGFRVSCGTCDNEYFNVLFVENLSDMSGVDAISIFTDPNTGVDTTYYNYFVELNASSMSQTFSGADIVADIVSQLTPQMRDHFTSVSAGTPSSTLVVSDKRYTPGGMGSVISGVYTDFRYNAVVENFYADLPEEIQYKDLPIYVSSVGPQHVINLHIPHLTLETLNLIDPPKLDFSDVDNANEWLVKIDAAAVDVTKVRATFGADSNRLEAAYNLLANTEIQLTSAESTIRDLDMSKQVIDFTKNQILLQSVQATLKQAEQLQQGILSIINTVG